MLTGVGGEVPKFCRAGVLKRGQEWSRSLEKVTPLIFGCWVAILANLSEDSGNLANFETIWLQTGMPEGGCMTGALPPLKRGATEAQVLLHNSIVGNSRDAGER